MASKREPSESPAVSCRSHVFASTGGDGVVMSEQQAASFCSGETSGTVKATFPNGQATYVHDALGRSVASASVADVVTYGWDAASNLVLESHTNDTSTSSRVMGMRWSVRWMRPTSWCGR